VNSEISRNSAYYGGGVRFQAIGRTNLINCVIKENSSRIGSDGGGGIHAQFAGGSAADELARNCLIVRNVSGSNAGGVWKRTTVGSLIACTIASNYAAWCGGILNDSSSAHKDCIIYGNTSVNDANYNDIYNGATAYTNDFYYSCVGKLMNPANGNITVNPQLVSLSGGNYQLSSTSPCINKGTNLPWMDGAVDLDGCHRIDRFSGQVDMGAYEYLRQGSLFIGR
jgi:hypothetical protein